MIKISELISALHRGADNVDVPAPTLEYFKEEKAGLVQYRVVLSWGWFKIDGEESKGLHGKVFIALSEAEKYGAGIIVGVEKTFEVLNLQISMMAPYYRGFTETEENEIQDRLFGDCNF